MKTYYNTAKLNNFQHTLIDFMKRQRVAEIMEDFDFKHEAKVYIGSGQMFNEFGRLGLELIADICEAVNLDYYLPQQNTNINDKGANTPITNKMIVDGDNQELESCNILFSHFTIPEDSGLSAECGRFGHMQTMNPKKHYASVAILDDIRKLTVPNPMQTGVENQSIYMNSYTAGLPEHFEDTLYDCFLYMFKKYEESGNQQGK